MRDRIAQQHIPSIRRDHPQLLRTLGGHQKLRGGQVDSKAQGQLLFADAAVHLLLFAKLQLEGIVFQIAHDALQKRPGQQYKTPIALQHGGSVAFGGSLRQHRGL